MNWWKNSFFLKCLVICVILAILEILLFNFAWRGTFGEVGWTITILVVFAFTILTLLLSGIVVDLLRIFRAISKSKAL